MMIMYFTLWSRVAYDRNTNTIWRQWPIKVPYIVMKFDCIDTLGFINEYVHLYGLVTNTQTVLWRCTIMDIYMDEHLQRCSFLPPTTLGLLQSQYFDITCRLDEVTLNGINNNMYVSVLQTYINSSLFF
jgi:hypothetical protein